MGPRTENPQRPLQVVSPWMRRVLAALFLLFALLALDSVYLSAVTLLEWSTGEIYQDNLYLLIFLAHLVLGVVLIPVFLAYALPHLRRAWRRPNRAAVRAGLALFTTALVVLASGVVLTRFGFFEINDPRIREPAYWIHVISPLVLIWLFVLHRLAGHRIRWGIGARWAAVAVALGGVMIGWHTLNQGSSVSSGASSVARERFFPSLAKTDTGDYLPTDALMREDYCAQCHEDIARDWRHSAHRQSSFNNPPYRFSVNELRELSLEQHGDVRKARFCAGCHDPSPFFNGSFEDPDFDEDSRSANAGITCTACHAIQSIDSLRGNSDYTIAAPEHYPFASSYSPVLRWVNRQLIRAKPEFHKKTFLKPFHRTSKFCSTCHKVHLPPEVNDYRWLRGQDHYDAWLLSGVSGHGITSFYYPPKAVTACAKCHMPLKPSEDPAARYFDGADELSGHDHLFAAANTGIPHMLGMPSWVNEAHRKFLEGALRVDLFGLREGGTLEGELVAPLGPELPTLRPGESYLLEVVLRTVRLGHLFTQGTADSNEIWVEVGVSSDREPLAASGDRDAKGAVDPWAYRVNAYVLGKDGERIDRRNAQDIVVALYNHQIPPGAGEVVHYRLDVPKDASGPLTVEVKLQYRKFDTTYLQYIEGEAFDGNDLPVVTIASDRLRFPVAGAPGSGADREPSDVPSWERWNDYGIGLLRQGALRQAEAAFTEVERLDRPDGPLNLARVYLREGRLDAAVTALERAARFDPPARPWSVAWFTALVNRQNGYLDEAIEDLEAIANTEFAEARQRGFDFSRDYRVLNTLGETLYERARLERGEARREQRLALLEKARARFEQALAIDTENATAHYNLSLIYEELGDSAQASRHRALHLTYKRDENARQRVVAQHRTRHPAANHAAESIVVYELRPPGAHGTPPATLADGPGSAGEDS
jgi:tetratricopeptide (TPR) repeat protein